MINIIIELPEGFNGHTVKMHSEPIAYGSGLTVKLRCAEPGREHETGWFFDAMVKRAVDLALSK